MRLPFLCFLSLLLAGSCFARERRIDACAILDQPGTTYILQQDVTSPGTCFLIAADRITLDLNRHTVTYGTGTSWLPGQETTQHVHAVLGQACWDTSGRADSKLCAESFSQLTVRNGSILQAERAPPYSHAIRFGQGNARGLTVEDVNIRISSPSTVGLYVHGSGGGSRIRNVTVEDRSVSVLNRHQLEGAAVRLMAPGKAGEPDRIDGLHVIGGPQSGIVATNPGSQIVNARIGLKGMFTNDFGLFLLADRIQAEKNSIAGRSRGIQVDARNIVVQDNSIVTFEEPVNPEYGGCQLAGTFGIQLESRSARATITRNDVTARATACDARAFRATETKPENGNRSHQNVYRAVRGPGASGKAISASFSGARDVLLEGDTLQADTFHVEIDWDGAENITLRGVTFVKGANAGKDYATFALVPGSNNPAQNRTRAELRVVDPIFRDGASANSFLMHPIGFNKWAMPAEYSVQWTYRLTVVSAQNLPMSGVEVIISDSKGREVSKAITGADGRVPPVVLSQFRRYNMPHGIEKEEFTYQVRLKQGERTREFSLQVTAPTDRTEVLR